MKELPPPSALLEARDWLGAGAPAASKHHDAKESVKTLLDLIAALPSRIELYCYGTPAWRKAMGFDDDKEPNQ